ncbi:MAG: LamG domain-containing protein [Burkholderiales bacterium]|nr:LamG domain-containing protein [Burkholderiales bacterium]MDR4517433.1 LamG domain-containing protein [Nitrosomonas sp.]
MNTRNQYITGVISYLCLGMFAITVQAEPTPVATYTFDNSFSAQEADVVAITPIDPLSENSFMTDMVFGEERVVYRFDGNRSFDEQAGLLLFSRSALGNSSAYSVELVFQFEADESDPDRYKVIFGVSNRQDDYAFYVDPENRLEVFPDLTATDTFSYDTYHHVVLTQNNDDVVSVYLNGVLQVQGTSTSMNFSTFPNNPERLIHFFVDNGSEFSDGRVALIRLYDTELTLADVQEISSNPFERCTATFSANGTLLVPCVRITNEFGVVSMYEAELKLVSSGGSPSFRLISAQQISVSQVNNNNCTAVYSNNSTVSLPCVNVSDIFGGVTRYSADLELIIGSNPLTFSLKQAKQRN